MPAQLLRATVAHPQCLLSMRIKKAGGRQPPATTVRQPLSYRRPIPASRTNLFSDLDAVRPRWTLSVQHMPFRVNPGKSGASIRESLHRVRRRAGHYREAAPQPLRHDPTRVVCRRGAILPFSAHPADIWPPSVRTPKPTVFRRNSLFRSLLRLWTSIVTIQPAFLTTKTLF